jgi:hypothetical protein
MWIQSYRKHVIMVFPSFDAGPQFLEAAGGHHLVERIAARLRVH